MLASTLDKGTLIGRIGQCWEKSSRRVDMSSRLNANIMSLLEYGLGMRPAVNAKSLDGAQRMKARSILTENRSFGSPEVDEVDTGPTILPVDRRTAEAQ